ncbi:MAG TPA: hypothetical protein VKE40_04540 [Gemmataceae bacterium]|nr:hypothetical protein [Gemmataceae bacterium]
MGKRVGLGALCALLLVTGEAGAGLLPIHVAITPEGNDFRYTYSVLLQSDAVLKPGDYFTIFDFAGLVSGTNNQPGSFTFSTDATGPVPTGVVPNDDPALPNLTWRYTGTDASLVGQLGLGDFSVVSQYDDTHDDHFTGQTHRVVDGHLDSNITDTQVPVPESHHCGAAEPSSLLLLLFGIPVALGFRVLRRRP